MLEGVTLGSYIRGARLGFHPVGNVGYLRVSCLPRKRWLLHIVAQSALPRRPLDKEPHFIWWAPNHNDRERVEEALLKVIHDALGPVRIRKGQLRLIVDDNGRRLQVG